MLKTSVVGLGIKIAGAALAFLSNIMIANLLGAEQSGYYYYLISLLGVATSVVIFGGQTYILKAAPVLIAVGQLRHAAQLIIGIAARSTLFAVIFLALLYACIHTFISALPDILSKNPALLFLAGSVPILAANVVLSHTLQVYGRVALAFLTSGLSHSIIFVAAITLFEPDNSKTLSALYLITSVAVCLHLLLLTYKHLNVGSLRQGIALMSIRESARLFVVQVGLEMLTQSPVLLLGAFGALPADVAGYAIASRAALMLSLIYAVVNRIVLPQFSKLYAVGKLTEMRREFFRAIFIMSAVALPFAILFVIFAHPILSLFGEEFTRYASTFYILVMFQSMNVLTGPAGNLLMMADRQELFRNLVIVGLALVLVLGWVLIPRYDALGAALAITLGYGFVNLSSFVAALRIMARREN